MLNIADLYLFELAVASGSFTKAAAQGYLTPPAIMHRMNELEQTIGTSLLNRSSHGISLTPAGQLLHQQAPRLIKDSQALAQAVQQESDHFQRVIRIGTSALNPANRLNALWSAVLTRLPDYHLQYVPLETLDYSFPDQYQHLGENVDVLFGPSGFASTPAQTHFLQLGTYHFTIAMHVTDPLAKSAPINLTDLKDQTVQVMASSAQLPIVNQIRQHLATPEFNITLQEIDPHYTIETFNHLAVSDQYLLSLECWDQVLPGIVARLLNVAEQLPYGLFFPKQPNPFLQKFIMMVQAIARE